MDWVSGQGESPEPGSGPGCGLAEKAGSFIEKVGHVTFSKKFGNLNSLGLLDTFGDARCGPWDDPS